MLTKRLFTALTAAAMMFTGSAITTLTASADELTDTADKTYMDEFFEKPVSELPEYPNTYGLPSRELIISFNIEKAKNLVAELEGELEDIGSDSQKLTYAIYDTIFDKMHLKGIVPEEVIGSYRNVTYTVIDEETGEEKDLEKNVYEFNLPFPDFLTVEFNNEKGQYELGIDNGFVKEAEGDNSVCMLIKFSLLSREDDPDSYISLPSFTYDYGGETLTLSTDEMARRMVYTANTYGDKAYFTSLGYDALVGCTNIKPVTATGADLYDPTIVYGDVDGNGSVEIADAVSMNKCQTNLCVLMSDAERRADVDLSGSFDSQDIVYIMQYLVGTVTLPVGI
jgi:hypothetical protein